MEPFTEDAEIMAAREEAEHWWRTLAQPEEKAAWIARLDTRPPFDIKERFYITTAPSNRAQFLVSRQTQYAWSQIWGTLRLGRQLITTPTTPTPKGLVFTDWLHTAEALTVSLDYVDHDGDLSGVSVYATPPCRGSPHAPQWLLRHVETFSEANLPLTFDISTRYLERWPLDTEPNLWLRAGLINANNELSSLTPVIWSPRT